MPRTHSVKRQSSPASIARKCKVLEEYLATKQNVLFLTTSTRYVLHKVDIPKSTQLANAIAMRLREKGIETTLIDVPQLNIHPCEGNISALRGNRCGIADATLKDKKKNPTGYLRCWASMNNKDDELWKIANALFQSECVVFFVSTRWGQTNSVYQRLFERLSWIENRISSLGQNPIPLLKNLEAGIVLFGHNWRGAEIVKTQKENFRWFHFKTPKELSFHWQYTSDAEEESRTSYHEAIEEFQEVVQIILPQKSDAQFNGKG